MTARGEDRHRNLQVDIKVRKEHAGFADGHTEAEGAGYRDLVRKRGNQDA